MKETIKAAIQNKEMLSFQYDGHPRVVEPHCLGYSDRGNLSLRAYQTEGTGKSRVPDWKLFKSSKIQSLETIEKYFSDPRPGYSPNDSDLNPIVENLQ